jgi:predicted CopG family antitoxin
MKTIALDEQTYRKLEELKEELGTKSYREVIIALLEKSKGVSGSMKGAFPKLKPLTKEEEREIEGENE